MPFTVASVPYVNAVPLVSRFEHLGAASPVRVEYEVPSALPARLSAGADAVLVSSIEALRKPGARMVADVCIGSRGAVESVRLFSRVPFERIGILALDASSMTSNALARILLAETFGCRPQTVVRPSAPPEELEGADACVLIGDLGMASEGRGMRVLDLGQAWAGLTGLPFVWAGWIGTEGLTPVLAAHLSEAWQWARGVGWESTLALAEAHSGWPRPLVERYLSETIVYAFDDDLRAGLACFAEKLRLHGIEPSAQSPVYVGAADPIPGGEADV